MNASFARWAAWVESAPVQRVITGLIVANAVLLGIETVPTLSPAAREVLALLDALIVAAFVAELTVRIGHHRLRFFRDGWNVFDFVVVAIALVPSGAGLSVLRALRVLRVLRLINTLPRLKLVVRSLLASLPGLGIIMLLQGLLFYVAAVIATNLFAASFSEWFGTLGRSVYTLFQVMTLESWSMGIVRPVMEVYPLAWLFFVPFILIATFTMLNLFIAVIVSAMQIEQDLAKQQNQEPVGETLASHSDAEALMRELKALRAELAEMRTAMTREGAR